MVPLRGRSKPLMILPLNGYGEPVLPRPDEKVKDLPRWEYLPHLIRTIATLALGEHSDSARENAALTLSQKGRACGKSPHGLHVPWAHMAKDIRTYVSSNYVPDTMTSLFWEPSGLKVKECLTLLWHWYGRQEEGHITFTFDRYVDEDGCAAESEP